MHLDFVGFVLTTVGLWFVGMAIEQARGPRRTSVLFFAAGLLANLVIAGVWRLRGFGPIPFVDGCSFSVMALFVAFARMYGRQPVQFWPTTLMVQARYMVLGLAGIAALVTIAQGNWPWLAGLFVAIAVGFFGGAPGGGRRSGRSSRTRGTFRSRAGCGAGSASSTVAIARRRNT